MHRATRKSDWLRHVLRLSLLLVVSIAIVATLSVAGVLDAVDNGLQRAYYRVHGADSPSSSVLLVALDENTARSWGAPPWASERFDHLLDEILSGDPAAVAVLEGSHLLLRGKPGRSDDAADAVSDGRLLMPAERIGAAGFAQPVLRIDRGAVEQIELSDESGSPSVLARVAVASGLEIPAGDAMPIHYAGPPDSLPTIAAHRIVGDQIPAGVFSGRIVLIGAQGHAFAPLLPTPVGPMSPAEIQAHALTGLLQGSVWQPFPTWWYWLAIALLALLMLLAIPRIETMTSVVVIAVIAALAVAGDYWLFTSGVALVGAAGVLAVLAVTVFVAWISERRRLRRELAGLSRWLARQAQTELQTSTSRGSEEEFLGTFMQASRTYVDFHSAIFAELPQGKYHLADDSFLCLDTEPGEIFERRRDVRREPYAKAYRTHRPEWSVRPFMDQTLELKTLMVPLVELGRILGFWVVNFPRTAKISKRKIRLIEMLGAQASIALDRRRLQQRAWLQGQEVTVRGSSLLLSRISDTQRSAQSMVRSQNHIDELFENLPVGVLVATLWGEIELMNKVMRDYLDGLGMGDPTRTTLSEVIATVSGKTHTEVDKQLRSVMTERSSIEIATQQDDHTKQADIRHLALSRISGSDDENAQVGIAHLVLTASRPGQTVMTETPWIGDLSEDTRRAVAAGAVSIRRSVRETESAPPLEDSDEISDAVPLGVPDNDTDTSQPLMTSTGG